jgi:hypothetical protein
MWRNNDDSKMPWSAPFVFGQNVGRVDAVTMIQSNYGSPGNMELIARVGDRLQFFWRDSGPQFKWSGPFRILVPSVALQAIETSDGRFVRVTGTNFSENAGVKTSYDLSTGGAPDTHQLGDHQDSTDPAGAFTDDIKVNVTPLGQALVSVLDENTQMRVDASIN